MGETARRRHRKRGIKKVYLCLYNTKRRNTKFQSDSLLRNNRRRQERIRTKCKSWLKGPPPEDWMGAKKKVDAYVYDLPEDKFEEEGKSRNRARKRSRSSPEREDQPGSRYRHYAASGVYGGFQSRLTQARKRGNHYAWKDKRWSR